MSEYKQVFEPTHKDQLFGTFIHPIGKSDNKRERLKKLLAQRNSINREIDRIQHEINEENTMHFNETMNDYHE